MSRKDPHLPLVSVFFRDVPISAIFVLKQGA